MQQIAKKSKQELEGLSVDELVQARNDHPEMNTLICETIYRKELLSMRWDSAQERLVAMRNSRERLTSICSDYRNGAWIRKHKDLSRIVRTVLLAVEPYAVLKRWVRSGVLTSEQLNAQYEQDWARSTQRRKS